MHKSVYVGDLRHRLRDAEMCAVRHCQTDRQHRDRHCCTYLPRRPVASWAGAWHPLLRVSPPDHRTAIPLHSRRAPIADMGVEGEEKSRKGNPSISSTPFANYAPLSCFGLVWLGVGAGVDGDGDGAGGRHHEIRSDLFSYSVGGLYFSRAHLLCWRRTHVVPGYRVP